MPLNAFGDSINVSVDLPIFTDADKIVIYGSVSTDTVLQVMIIDPDGIVVVNKDVTLPSGDFTYDIVIGEYELNRSGHYDISVVYGNSKITEQFFYDSGHNVNPMKVDGAIESLTESELITVFTIATAIIIGVLIFLARGSIFRKKTEYDTDEWESKKNRDYEKYHSEWMSDEISFERKGKDKLSDEDFRNSLLSEDLPDYYAILQIQATASQNEIKSQFRKLAKKKLPSPIFHYIDGAADDEITYRRNTSAFNDVDLVPNVLRGVENVDLSTTIFGKKLDLFSSTVNNK